MKILKKTDIDTMAKLLPVIPKEKQSSIVAGGVRLDTNTASNKMDCSLRVIAYLSRCDYNDMEDFYLNQYTADWNSSTPNDPITREMAEERFKKEGMSPYYAEAYYKKYVSQTWETTKYQANNQYDAEMEMEVASKICQSNGIYASISMADVTLKNGNKESGNRTHGVAITDYDSGSKTFSFWDPQQGCSGTCSWEDMNYFMTH